MILPVLDGLFKFSKAPFTWMIFILCMMTMGVLSENMEKADKALESYLSDEYFMSTQGMIYAKYLQQESSRRSKLLNEMSQMALSGDAGKIELMAHLALRDSKFIAEAPQLDLWPDQVAKTVWLEKVAEIQKIKDENPIFDLGLTSENNSYLSWISYLFVHSGWTHFAGNMFFLLIFGGLLESVMGSAMVAIVYLGTGMIAAATFTLLSGVSMAPLIGASGAVSGLMAMTCALLGRRRVRYFYWLLIPGRKYMGFAFFPAWWTFAMWFASDVAGYLSAVQEMGGVAYAAHLGGEFAGVALGLSIGLIAKKKWQERLKNHPLHSELSIPGFETEHDPRSFNWGKPAA